MSGCEPADRSNALLAARAEFIAEAKQSVSNCLSVLAVAGEAHVLCFYPPQMVHQLVPRLMAYEHPVDLSNVAVVLVLRFRYLRNPYRIPLMKEDPPDALMVASGAIDMFAHAANY